MRILCLQHVAFETPAAIADWAQARHLPMQTILMHNGVKLPRLADVDMLVLMGGPMSVHDSHELPGLPTKNSICAARWHWASRCWGCVLARN
jgi:GMP synthase-like glutamine amidotransferase